MRCRGLWYVALKIQTYYSFVFYPQPLSSPSPFALTQPCWPSYRVLNIQAVPTQGLCLALPSAWESLPPGLQRTHCLPNTQISGQCLRLREVCPKHVICQNALPSTPHLATHLFLTPHPALFFFISLIVVWDCSIAFVSLPHWTVSFMRTVIMTVSPALRTVPSI